MTNYQDRYHFFALTVFLMLLMLLLSTSGCIQLPEGARRSEKTDSNVNSEDFPPPDFPEEGNFFDHQDLISSPTLPYRLQQQLSPRLRGSDIHSFIENNQRQQTHCLVAHFAKSPGRQLLIMAVRPQSQLNLEEQTREFYYILSPEPPEENINGEFCNKAGLGNRLESDFPELTVQGRTYRADEVCPDCSSRVLSTSIKVYSPAGNPISSLDTSRLQIILLPPLPTIPPQGVNCQNSSHCKGQKYDCCLQGQCVNHGQEKPRAFENDNYLQAIIDAENDPNSIANYPQIFYVCENTDIPGGSENGTDEGPSEEELAQERFNHLERIYNCLNPEEGEMSICVKSYPSASTMPASDPPPNPPPNPPPPLSFTTGVDDRNFSSTYMGSSMGSSSGLELLGDNSIVKIVYEQKTLYENGATIAPVVAGQLTFTGNNDTLTESTSVAIDKSILTPSQSESSPSFDRLNIFYKVDGSCQLVRAGLARCSKFYVQGEDEGKVTDHLHGRLFKLPAYANMDRPLSVIVDGDKVSSSTYTKTTMGENHPGITFKETAPTIYDTYQVEITFYVNLREGVDDNEHPIGHPNAFLAKAEAQEEVDELCDCEQSQNCGLQTKIEDEEIVAYECLYPEPRTPTQERYEFYLSTKTAPVRYFDKNGAYHPTIPPQEGQQEQEGTLFKYENGNQLTPNNSDHYIGFNEIYGSFTLAIGSALPAREVLVTKGRRYDITVGEGSFSTCPLCGKDYFARFLPLFPSTLPAGQGGGYIPDGTTTDPFSAEKFRAHDLIFGRACFVPATMLPWVHQPMTEVNDQRRIRQQAQHFLFANGLQRDWYGMDYGAVIGSFDGVAWFPIGSHRIIRARSSRLFLAFNSYFGDLPSSSLEGNFLINIEEASSLATSNPQAITDFENDGAQCQKFHQCESDRDCATQLGPDYSCENIRNIKTRWPVFDNHGRELANESRSESLYNILNYRGGPRRRCVYRGRGAPCHNNYAAVNTDEGPKSYAGIAGSAEGHGLHACTSNYYCQSFSNPNMRFNDRINRIPFPVVRQNRENAHSFGLGAPLIGRPYQWIGNRPLPLPNSSLFGMNSDAITAITALCLPGRNPSPPNSDTRDLSFSQYQDATPSLEQKGDQVQGLGVTFDCDPDDYPNNPVQCRHHYLSSCSIFDSAGNYFHKQPSLSPEAAEVIKQASAQALSTAALDIFAQGENGFSLPPLTHDFTSNSPVSNVTLQKNRCLRAPGQSCHTTMECAPNPWISNKLQSIENDGTQSEKLNKFEILFWQQELICSQSLSSSNPNYKLTENRCCREVGQKYTLGPSHTTTVLAPPTPPSLKIAGIDLLLSEQARYSLNSLYKRINNENSAHGPLFEVPERLMDTGEGDPPFSLAALLGQSDTFAKAANQISCSGHWIRNFHPDNTGGGGHDWSREENFQNFDVEDFRCLNWFPNADNCPDDSNVACPNEPFSCEGIPADDPNCRARSFALGGFDENEILEWLARFELLGIYQVPIPQPEDNHFKELQCLSTPSDQGDPDVPENDAIIPGFLNPLEEAEYKTNGNSPQYYYSAGYIDNFHKDDSSDSNNISSSYKKLIFDPHSISTCLPTGQVVSEGTSPNSCCTGYLPQSFNRCVLPDYANVSLYFNRFVSSEAQELSADQFDQYTGYIKNSQLITHLACSKEVCASGKLARGVAISNLNVYGTDPSASGEGGDSNLGRVRRFLQGSDEGEMFDLDAYFRAGLRWNHHVYCVPADIPDDQNNYNIITTNCF